MDHADHVALLRAGVSERAGATESVWADLGAGDGAFTLALADLLGPGARIHAVDRDAGSLRRNAREVAARFPSVELRTLVADFTAPLDLPGLDGVVMANSLHFTRDKAPVLDRVRALIRPGGRLIVVEYDTDHGNPWVPYPFSYATWERLAATSGFERTRLIGRVPSRFLGAIYAAASDRSAWTAQEPAERAGSRVASAPAGHVQADDEAGQDGPGGRHREPSTAGVDAGRPGSRDR